MFTVRAYTIVTCSKIYVLFDKFSFKGPFSLFVQSDFDTFLSFLIVCVRMRVYK